MKVGRMAEPLRLLVMGDAHYAPSEAEAAGSPPDRRCTLGLELVRRAVADARLRGGFDAVVLLGDLLDNGDLPGAAAALVALADSLREASPETPLVVVPGNHDGDPARLLGAFADRPGLHGLGGYRLITFADAYDEGDRGTRSAADRRLLRQIAEKPGGPLVAIQHNPLYPRIESDYPYMLSNSDALIADYAAAHVLASLSGHYHAGQPPAIHDGTLYLTVPALCEAPYCYAIVTLDGLKATAETRRLRMPEAPPVVDTHIHTEFGYCARDVRSGPVIERARTIGLAGICLVEHAPQLYMLPDDFFAGRHIADPALWRTNEHNRGAAYRREMGRLRSPFLRVGLEVEIDRDGRLTLHDEEVGWSDVLIGAVHFLPEDFTAIPAPRFTRLFMRATEGLLAAGVDILAHPWRIFRWAELPVAPELFVPVAQALAETGTAAEINLHGNEPDPEFLAECLSRGVKVALASDAHCLFEVGGLGPHLDLLRQVAGTDDIGPFLWYP
jgi:histidinol phosphatase-like PHP family hydrolase